MLREFSLYCKDQKIKPKSRQEIIEALKTFSEYWEERGIKDRAFIKKAVFDMLYYQCNNGAQKERLTDIIVATVAGGMSLNQ
jgi:hypothetical protein